MQNIMQNMQNVQNMQIMQNMQNVQNMQNMQNMQIMQNMQKCKIWHTKPNPSSQIYQAKRPKPNLLIPAYQTYQPNQAVNTWVHSAFSNVCLFYWFVFLGHPDYAWRQCLYFN